jgi:hypothetical protein
MKKTVKTAGKVKTATPADYARLKKQGFSNSQIAVFWRTGARNVAAYAAHAKMKGLV